jgi:hypothetical protein
MPNINLATEDVSENKPSLVGKGLTLSIVILVLTFVLYGALLFINYGLSSKIKTAQDEYGVEYNKFLSGNGNEILDFKNRGDAAEKAIAENKSMADVLSRIESSTLPAVHLDSLKYDESKEVITLLCIGDNFQTEAKQILSFKQNDYFSAVIPGRSFVDPQNANKLSFYIDLKIK